MLMNLPVRQTSPPVPVRTLMVYLDEDCNLRCHYCFVNKKRRRMSTETIHKIPEFAFRDDVAGRGRELQINFFGGEPFLAVDEMELLARLMRARARRQDRDVRFSVTTNGTIFSPSIARLISTYKMSILLSVDGDEQASLHRPTISGKNSFQQVLRNIPAFLEACQGRLTVRCTFHSEDYRLVDRVVFLQKLGVRSIALCPVLECDWVPHQEALEKEYRRLADWFLAQLAQGSHPPLELTWAYLKQWHLFQENPVRPRRPCELGYTLLGIDPDGNVLPCHRYLYRRHDRLGTLEQPELVGSKREQFLAIDSSRIPDCQNCMASPICGGGCRVAALSQGLGLHDAYLGHCIPMRAHASAVYHIYDQLTSHGRQTAEQHVPNLSSDLQELLIS